jgi:hypothetical protein
VVFRATDGGMRKQPDQAVQARRRLLLVFCMIHLSFRLSERTSFIKSMSKGN